MGGVWWWESVCEMIMIKYLSTAWGGLETMGEVKTHGLDTSAMEIQLRCFSLKVL